MKEFTNLYSLQKTLRFELKPIGKTLETIQAKGLLAQDEQRADDYQKVKKIIDEYHKNFIDNALQNVQLTNLQTFYDLYIATERDKDAIKAEQKRLRQEIGISLKGKKDNEQAQKYKKLFEKELIKELLPEYLGTERNTDREYVEKFSSFTTYFTGFHENRKNMYSDEEKSTAIAYRLIHENLPKFIDNLRNFEKFNNEQKINKTELDRLETELSIKIVDVFRLNYFNKTLTQNGIDLYNQILGGFTKEDGTKIKGLNELANLYNQQQSDKNNRIPKLKPLYKQILSDRETLSWLPEQFENDNAVLESINGIYINLNQDKNILQGLQELLNTISDYDLNKIYICNDASLTNISKQLFDNYAAIPFSIKEKLKEQNPKKNQETTEKYIERIEKEYKKSDSFSIGFINSCISDKKLEDYFIKNENLFNNIHTAYEAIKDLLNIKYPDDRNLAQDNDNVEKIKIFLDSIKELQWFIKLLLGSGNEAEKDEKFYGQLNELYEELKKIIPLYDKVRNYMTRKPYSTEKIKLNFENSTLLNGWDVNKERDNAAVLLRKEGMYYLAIMPKEHNKAFESIEESNSGYEKVEYKLLPGPNKMLPKVFFSKSRIEQFNPAKTLLENYEKGTHKKGVNFNLSHCRALIYFFKQSLNIHEDWKKFDFRFSETSTYNDISDFYREVAEQGYKITFRNISEEYINNLVQEGKLYLFQIYNKDFSPHSKGTPNMHTLYWKELFSDENLKNVVYKLNGEAEVFFRKSSIKFENKIVHQAGEPIKNKNQQNKKLESTFNYDLIKDKRYTVDQFQFHVPITINFKAVENDRINNNVNLFIKENGIKHIIGIDRGERHLLYLSLIDLNGKIVKQFSLNEIVNEWKGIQHTTDYHKLLNSKEVNRDEARKNWKTIETIKELKEGYISQVIHKIATLMVEYNAVVVMEDLNFGFKTSRQKVEKQVYQKFEKMLIDKLNYLVDKNKGKNEYGGLLKAYQLTNKFDSFKSMGKQNGFLFYVPAYYTSKIDPVTGFVSMFDIRYESIEKTQQFFGKFKDIRYNKEKNYFEFIMYDYTLFNPKATETRLDWTICTYGQRIKTFRNSERNNQWDNHEVILTKEFEKLFAEYKIDTNNNLKESITAQTEKEFFERLLFLFKLTVQIRNSITNSDTDYLISPVADKNGNFYDSREATDKQPDNADANGAYNIARKGLWCIEQIKQTQDLAKLKLAISNKEWLQYVQK
jgi:CRISPR-associated protein Cpf1